jgi:hypothetical protein
VGKIIKVVFSVVLTVSLLGVLSGCFGASAEESIKNISMTQQSTSNVTQDNYTVNLKCTTAEWIALTEDKKVELATLGYDKAVEQIVANASSNFNILGMTSSGEDGAKSDVVFMLNHETSRLAIYTGESTSNKPNLLKEIEVKYPLS